MPTTPVPPDGPGRFSLTENARRTADLINVLTGERPDPDAVLAVLRRYGEPEPLRLGPRDALRMREAALLLREVFATGSTAGAVAVLNDLLREHAGPLRLTSHDGALPWHPHIDPGDDAPWEVWLMTSSCLALTVLLWDRQRPPGGVCASPPCGNVFVTLAGGPDQRYCSRRCATRERVAAHRRKNGGAGGGS